LLVHGVGGLITFYFTFFYVFFLVCDENIFYVLKTSAGENEENFLAAFRVFLFGFFGVSTLRWILAMEKESLCFQFRIPHSEIPKPQS
jgi:hypothetical protein